MKEEELKLLENELSLGYKRGLVKVQKYKKRDDSSLF